MTRMIGPDCAGMWNLINTHMHTHTNTPFRIARAQFNKYTHTHTLINTHTHTHTHDITIVTPCAGSNLENAAHQVGQYLADAIERKKNKYRASSPAAYSLFPLAMSICDEVGSDVHALIKELAIRRVEHRPEMHSNESQHLTERTEVASLRL